MLIYWNMERKPKTWFKILNILFTILPARESIAYVRKRENTLFKNTQE
jgi:TRAP-type mannitol/chloroaromatic compound transport system permease small subunit